MRSRWSLFMPSRVWHSPQEVYRCYIEVVEGGAQLKVRGYIGISLLGRTQYWRKGRPSN